MSWMNWIWEGINEPLKYETSKWLIEWVLYVSIWDALNNADENLTEQEVSDLTIFFTVLKFIVMFCKLGYFKGQYNHYLNLDEFITKETEALREILGKVRRHRSPDLKVIDSYNDSTARLYHEMDDAYEYLYQYFDHMEIFAKTIAIMNLIIIFFAIIIWGYASLHSKIFKTRKIGDKYFRIIDLLRGRDDHIKNSYNMMERLWPQRGQEKRLFRWKIRIRDEKGDIDIRRKFKIFIWFNKNYFYDANNEFTLNNLRSRFNLYMFYFLLYFCIHEFCYRLKLFYEAYSMIITVLICIISVYLTIYYLIRFIQFRKMCDQRYFFNENSRDQFLHAYFLLISIEAINSVIQWERISVGVIAYVTFVFWIFFITVDEHNYWCGWDQLYPYDKFIEFHWMSRAEGFDEHALHNHFVLKIIKFFIILVIISFGLAKRLFIYVIRPIMNYCIWVNNNFFWWRPWLYTLDQIEEQWEKDRYHNFLVDEEEKRRAKEGGGLIIN